MRRFRPNETKLRELILYLARKSESDPKCGAVKLNKLLFFSDFIFYAKTGKPITGSEYQRIEHGPALRRLLPVRTDMLSRGECAIQVRNYYGKPQKRLVALRDPKLSVFTAEEIALVDEVLEAFCDHDARTISGITHDLPVWQAFGDKETIPYEAIFVNNRPLTESERRHALTIKPTSLAA